MNALSTTHEHTKERRGKDEKNGGKKEEKDKGERGRGKERGSEGVWGRRGEVISQYVDFGVTNIWATE